MSAQQQFSFSDSRDARDVSIDLVESANARDADIAESCIRQVARKGKPFTTDDVLIDFPLLEEIREKRVLGAVMRRLCSEGLIVAGAYRSSSRRKSHARPKRVWIPVTGGKLPRGTEAAS